MDIRWRVLGLVLAGVLSVGGCAVNPVSGERELALVSEEQEIAIGRAEHPKILERYGAYDDAELQAYVQRIGEQVAEHSHRTDLIYRFTLLDSEEVNAFALPGGYIYITRGLLAYLNSEDELAAVLGHELGHVTARHSVRQVSAATAADLGFTLGSILVPELRNRGARDLFNVLGTALLRGYGREHELEADRLGAEYLAKSGRDPEAMIDVIRVLKNQEQFEIELAKEEKREPRVYHGVFATHPDNDERLQTVVAAAETLRSGEPRPSPKASFLRRLDGLVFGASAAQGILRGGAFYHQELDFGLRFPEGWQVENRPDRLLAFAPEREAALQLTAQDRNRRVSPERFLEERLGLENMREGRTITVNGLSGYTALAPVNSGSGTRDGRVALVYHGQRAYLFIGAAEQPQALSRYDETFLEAIHSFHPLTEEERALAQPLRLELIEAPRGRGFAALAEDARLLQRPEAQLRLLNGRYPDGEPTPGELLKTVR